MTPEHKLMNEVSLWCGKQGYICYRQDVGLFRQPKEPYSYIKIGMVGFPDLMIIKHNGEIAFVETKIHPRKPTKEQLQWHKILRDRGFSVGVAYNLDEAIAIIEKKP